MRSSTLAFVGALSSLLHSCYPSPQPDAAAPVPPPGVMAAAPPVQVAPLAQGAPVNVVAVAPTVPGTFVSPLAIQFQPPTPLPLAPPPVRPLPTLAALPILPHPTKYPKMPKLPTETDVTGCGVTWTGTEWIGAECLDPVNPAGQGRAARVVVPYAMMRQPALALPPVVDHRGEGSEGPIRHQGGPQCTAFAFTAALDHAYARWAGMPGNFSAMQIWSRYHKSDEAEAADGNIGDTVAAETDWPYDSHLAGSWRKCPKDPSKLKPGQLCSQEPDTNILRALDTRALAEITQIQVFPVSALDVLREKLAAGEDVVVGLRLHSYATAGDPGSKYIVADENDKPNEGREHHQVLLVGYAMTNNGNYYLVHNSWGVKWGDNGFAWMHEDVLRAYALKGDFVVPELQPRQVAAQRLRADGSMNPRCAPGLVPDSISSACAPRCPDGGPRHNNVCADGRSACPAGTINLTGMCMQAAPRVSGVDPASGVAFTCGDGGCSYEVPGGRLACRDAVCAVSCPAPSFRLATMPTGLACVE